MARFYSEDSQFDSLQTLDYSSRTRLMSTTRTNFIGINVSGTQARAALIDDQGRIPVHDDQVAVVIAQVAAGRLLRLLVAEPGRVGLFGQQGRRIVGESKFVFSRQAYGYARVLFDAGLSYRTRRFRPTRGEGSRRGKLTI